MLFSNFQCQSILKRSHADSETSRDPDAEAQKAGDSETGPADSETGTTDSEPQIRKLEPRIRKLEKQNQKLERNAES